MSVHHLVFDCGLQQLARSFLEQLFQKRLLSGEKHSEAFDGLTRERGERANAFLRILWKWLLSQDGNKEARGGGSSEGEADQ